MPMISFDYIRFRKYFNLWAFEKDVICQKFVERQVTLVEIDEKFTFYSSIVETLDQMRKYHDVRCVRINLSPLLESIKQHAKQWCTILGEELLQHVIDNMRTMRNEIKVSSQIPAHGISPTASSICFCYCFCFSNLL